MALTTVEEVLEDGGLDEENAYRVFRLNSDAELRERVGALIPRATAWLRSRAAAAYNSVDPDVSRLFQTAECYLTLRYLFEPLKARKVMGTHFPYDEEDSSRFAALIDVEWQERAEQEVAPYLTINIGDKPVCLPGLFVGRAISPLDPGVQTAEQELGDIIAATGFLESPIAVGASTTGTNP